MAAVGTRTFKNFIAGEWVDAASGETFESTSPADGETLGRLPEVPAPRTSTARSKGGADRTDAPAG